MRNLYFTASLLLVQISLSAQNVVITDDNFKNKLIAQGVDSNSDGDIQESEALAVEWLDVSNANINSLSGIESFVNLQGLTCENNNLTDLPLGNLIRLTNLNCNNNALTSLSFDYSNLRELRCAYNQLSGLNLSNSIYELDVSYNHLSVLDIPESAHYSYLDVSGNQISTLEFTGRTTLSQFSCNETQLTVLDFSNVIHFSESISIRNNWKLQSISFKNGSFDMCNVFGGGCHFHMTLTGNPMLSSICLDDLPHHGLTDETELEYFQRVYDLPNVTYNANCTNNPDENLGTVSNTKGENIMFYPNPVQNNLTIDVKNVTTINAINLYNTLGQVVKSIQPAMSNQIVVPMSDLSSGTYIIEILTPKGKTTSKLVKI